MPSWRNLRIPLSATGAGFLVEVLLYCCLPVWDSRPPAGPATLQEVAQLARAAGLEHGPDHRSGVVGHRLVVSDRPVTWQRAGLLRMNSPHHPGWAGTVVICCPYRPFLPNFDPDFSVLWGRMFVYGDPEIIRRLTGQPLPRDAGNEE